MQRLQSNMWRSSTKTKAILSKKGRGKDISFLNHRTCLFCLKFLHQSLPVIQEIQSLERRKHLWVHNKRKQKKKKKTNPQAPMVGLVVKTWNIWIWALLKSWDSKPLWYYQFLWIARLSAPLALPRRRTWARTQRSYNRSLSTKSCFQLQKEWRGSSN